MKSVLFSVGSSTEDIKANKISFYTVSESNQDVKHLFSFFHYFLASNNLCSSYSINSTIKPKHMTSEPSNFHSENKEQTCQTIAGGYKMSTIFSRSALLILFQIFHFFKV